MTRTVESETKLIAELEASYPPYDNTVGRWHENNRAWQIHHVAVRDAYWRRRMIKTKLEGGDLDATARVY